MPRWLAELQTALIAAVAEGVRAHVEKLRSRENKFYGYALLPGEPCDIRSIVAVFNSETDISVPCTDPLYSYYRFSVDEWAHWDHDGFAAANVLLVKANERLAALRKAIQFEVAHADALLNAVLAGLEGAKIAGVFGSEDPFLAVWISDSDHPIMDDSVRRLNSESVSREYLAAMG